MNGDLRIALGMAIGRDLARGGGHTETFVTRLEAWARADERANVYEHRTQKPGLDLALISLAVNARQNADRLYAELVKP